MKKFLLTIFILVLGLTAKSQDKLFYKDKTIDEVTIIEEHPDFIKYREFSDSENSVIYTIEKDYLQKIIFENGQVLDLSVEFINDSRLYVGQKSRAIKIDVAGISADYTFLTYEQAITPYISWEAGIIFIGAGFTSAPLVKDLNENPLGISINMGYKFKRSPIFYTERMRFSHIMRGTYIKPNMFVSTFQYNPDDHYCFPTRRSAIAGSLQMDFGNQLVLDDKYIVDYAAGIGYGFSTKQHYFSISNYGFNVIPPNITFSLTLRIGYLIKGKKLMVL